MENEAPVVSNEYLAGFIDGEGSISMYKAVSRKNQPDVHRYRIRVSISNTNKEVLQAIKNKYMTGSIYMPKLKERHKQVYALYFYDKSAIELIKDIFPYLIIKHQQAQLAIEFYNHLSKQKTRSITESSRAFRLKITGKLSELNQRGSHV